MHFDLKMTENRLVCSILQPYLVVFESFLMGNSKESEEMYPDDF